MNKVKMIRNSMQLSRNAMQKLHNISTSSLGRWEQGQTPSESSCERLVKAASAHGITTSVDWILHDIGDSPTNLNKTAPKALTELAKKLSNGGRSYTTFEVPDDCMLPTYSSQDWILAQRLSSQSINKLKPKVLLIDTEHGRYLRLLKPSKCPEYYDLVTTNPAADARCFYEERVIGIAVVVCHIIA